MHANLKKETVTRSKELDGLEQKSTSYLESCLNEINVQKNLLRWVGGDFYPPRRILQEEPP